MCTDLGHLQQVAVDVFLCLGKPVLFEEMVGPELAEVVVRVDVVECEDEVDEGLAAGSGAEREKEGEYKGGGLGGSALLGENVLPSAHQWSCTERRQPCGTRADRFAASSKPTLDTRHAQASQQGSGDSARSHAAWSVGMRRWSLFGRGLSPLASENSWGNGIDMWVSA